MEIVEIIVTIMIFYVAQVVIVFVALSCDMDNCGRVFKRKRDLIIAFIPGSFMVKFFKFLRKIPSYLRNL